MGTGSRGAPLSNFVKYTPLLVVFLTLFSVFGYHDETLSVVFDILHTALNNYLQIETEGIQQGNFFFFYVVQIFS